MAYQAIVDGARGLVFFGGHLTQVATPADASRLELDVLGAGAPAARARAQLGGVRPALVAPNAKPQVKASTAGRRARHPRRRRRSST